MTEQAFSIIMIAPLDPLERVLLAKEVATYTATYTIVGADVQQEVL